MDPISIQLAEALGWHWGVMEIDKNTGTTGWYAPNGKFLYPLVSPVVGPPDYAHDDSAIDAEVRKLPREQWGRYELHLAKVVDAYYEEIFRLLTATAAEKTRALIETLKEKDAN